MVTFISESAHHLDICGVLTDLSDYSGRLVAALLPWWKCTHVHPPSLPPSENENIFQLHTYIYSFRFTKMTKNVSKLIVILLLYYIIKSIIN